MVTMVVLTLASVVEWRRIGNVQLKANWIAARPKSTKEIVRQLFNGFCMGVLGLTGFECSHFIHSSSAHIDDEAKIRYSGLRIFNQARAHLPSRLEKSTFARHRVKLYHRVSSSSTRTV
jgi:hypothetical protein